ncbi:Rheacalcin-2 [Collichthys lucidus]|uniref:Rheacalcin-2 n=1 Tax=Collichthys lucidus TaxID=240159 RepID=A0A4U5V4N8_COLLU|nr:Rheacalcin-2 [Collichthys lucidus]
MRRREVILLLLSGCVSLCHLQAGGLVRLFHPVDQEATWTEAQQHCREMFTDLATIQDHTSNHDALQVLSSSKFWIGLSFNSSWMWSYKDQEVSEETWFTSWAENEPSYRECGAALGNGHWTLKLCGTKLFFACYSAEGDTHILVQIALTWSDAQAYCRSTYTDLSSIHSEQDNQQVSSLLWSGTGGMWVGWIGLHRKGWVWSDRSGAPYRQWANQDFDGTRACATMTSSSDWSRSDCSSRNFFLCYTDVRPSMSRSVKIRMKGGSADLNDPKVQDAILQQQKLRDGGIHEEVKLRWKKQLDGKVFHRGERTAPPAEQEEALCSEY